MMNGRRNQVRRALAGELDNKLPEVGFSNIHPGLLQRRVQVDLFRCHRLRLDSPFAVRGPRNLDNDVSSVARGLRPVNLSTSLANRLFELLQVHIEIGESMFLDSFGMAAQRVTIWQRRIATP